MHPVLNQYVVAVCPVFSFPPALCDENPPNYTSGLPVCLRQHPNAAYASACPSAMSDWFWIVRANQSRVWAGLLLKLFRWDVNDFVMAEPATAPNIPPRCQKRKRLQKYRREACIEINIKWTVRYVSGSFLWRMVGWPTSDTSGEQHSRVVRTQKNPSCSNKVLHPTSIYFGWYGNEGFVSLLK